MASRRPWRLPSCSNCWKRGCHTLRHGTPLPSGGEFPTMPSGLAWWGWTIAVIPISLVTDDLGKLVFLCWVFFSGRWSAISLCSWNFSASRVSGSWVVFLYCGRFWGLAVAHVHSGSGNGEEAKWSFTSGLWCGIKELSIMHGPLKPWYS